MWQSERLSKNCQNTNTVSVGGMMDHRLTSLLGDLIYEVFQIHNNYYIFVCAEVDIPELFLLKMVQSNLLLKSVISAPILFTFQMCLIFIFIM